MLPKKIGKFDGLSRITDLAREAALADLALVLRKERDLRDELRRLQNRPDETHWGNSDGRRSEVHDTWLDRRRIDLNVQLANVLSDKARLRRQAATALGRASVVKKLAKAGERS